MFSVLVNCAYYLPIFRSSSATLKQAIFDGANLLNCDIIDYGLLTTPQLHFIVSKYNAPLPSSCATENFYYETLVDAFKMLMVCNVK